MFKKFTTMMTAAILLATGLGVVGSTTANAANISITTIQGLTAPVNGATAVSSITSNSEYSGVVTWKITGTQTTVTTFGTDPGYTASIVLTLLNGTSNPSARPSSSCPISFTAAGSSSVNCNTDPNGQLTIHVAFGSSGGGGGGGGGGGLPACNADLLSSTSTIKGVAITTGQSRSISLFSDFYSNSSSARGSVNLTSAQATGSGTTVITTTDGSPVYWLYLSPSVNSFSASSISGTSNQASESIANPRGFVIRVVPTTCAEQYYWININVGGSSSSSSQTPEQIAAAAAAAARAAAEAAAAVRAAEIATAQTALSTVLKADKPGTLSEYRSANINITTTAALTRLNAEVLKLSAADRTDFAKIKAIADKIEFDESFFNATARPSIATYSTYGVTGVTERILPTINAKVLELPAALRADVKAMQEIAKVENFVDRVANTETRSTVSATLLVANGLLPATSPYKYSVVQGLAKYPEGSLNTMAKIEAAIKEQVAKAEAPKLRLAAIKAKIAARKK